MIELVMRGSLRFLSMTRRNSQFSVVLMIVLLFGIATAQAQNTLKIAAVVNDEIISVYDLSQRVGLVVTLSKLPDTPETQRRVAPSVLRKLIVEKLRQQEAERLEIEISDEEVNSGISELERANNMSPGALKTLLKNRGIDPQTLSDQVRAERAWVSVVRSLFRRLVSVSDQEVEDILEEARRNAGQPEYRVAEIFLAYDDKSRADVERTALQIHAQLGAGASWPDLARNFSQSASARTGGDMGWVSIAELGPVLGRVVGGLNDGQMSSPVTTDDGVYLLLLRNTRQARRFEASEADVTIGIHQLHLEIPTGADSATVSQITSLAQSLANGAQNCTSLDSIAKAEGSPLSGFLGTFNLKQLNPALVELVRPLGVNGISQPMRTGDGVIVLMVCSRDSKAGEDPVEKFRSDTRLRLTNDRMSRLAQQHLDKLRRDAFIDVRL